MEAALGLAGVLLGGLEAADAHGAKEGADGGEGGGYDGEAGFDNGPDHSVCASV